MKFVGYVAALSVVMAACSPTQPSSSVPTTLASLDPRVTSVGVPDGRPLSVLVVGDDVATAVGVALADALDTDGFAVSVQTGGLLTEYGDTYATPQLSETWDEAVAETSPDVVIVTNMVAAPETDCVGDVSEVAACESYAAEVGTELVVTEMIDTLSAGGAQVIWLDYPVLAPADWLVGTDTASIADDRARVMNAAVRSVALTDERVQVYSTRSVLGTSFERYRRLNDGWWELRNENGMTLCPKAAELVTASLLGQMLDNPPRFNSWGGGDWRNDAIFAPGPLSVNGCSDIATPTQPD